MGDTGRKAIGWRLLRWFWRFGVLVLILVLIAATVIGFTLPTLSEQILLEQLHGRGFTNVFTGVQGISIDRLSLGPLRIREGADVLAADSARILFRVSGLREGRVIEVDVSGLSCTVEIRDGKLNVVGLETLQRLVASLRGEAGEQASTPYQPSDVVERILLRSSQVILVYGGKRVTVPFAAEVLCPDGKPVMVQGLAAPLGTPVAVGLNIDVASGNGTINLEVGPTRLEPWLRRLVPMPLNLPSIASRVGGEAKFVCRAEIHEWKLQQASGQASVMGLSVAEGENRCAADAIRTTFTLGPDFGDPDVTFTVEGLSASSGFGQVGPFPLTGTFRMGKASVDAAEIPYLSGTHDVKGTTSLTVAVDGIGKDSPVGIAGALALGNTSAAGLSVERGTIQFSGTPEDMDAQIDFRLAPTLENLGMRSLSCRVRATNSDALAARAVGTLSIAPEAMAEALADGVSLTADPVDMSFEAAVQKQGSDGFGVAFELRTPERAVSAKWGKLAVAGTFGLSATLKGSEEHVALSTHVTAKKLRGGTPEYGATIGDAEADLTFRGVPQPGAALPSGWEAVCELRTPRQRLEITYPEGTVAAEGVVNQRIAVTPAGVDASGKVAIYDGKGTASGFVFSFEEAGAAIDSLHSELPSAEEQPDAVVTGRLTLTGARVQYGDQLDVKGLRVDLPVSWGTASGFQQSEPGSLAVGEFRCETVIGTGVECVCRPEGYGAVVDGVAHLTEPAVDVTLEQRIDWKDEPRLTLAWRTPRFHVGESERWYRLTSDMDELLVSGFVEANGSASIDPHGMAASLTASVTEGFFGYPYNEPTTKVSGISTTVRISDLLQLHSLPHQALTFETASVGTIPIDGGRILFQLESPESLFLERCELNWCGGRVHTQAFSLNPAKPDVNLVLFADGIDVIKVLDLFEGFEGEGQGILNGKLPLSWKGNTFSYSRGYLYSIPGQEGRLKLRGEGFLTRFVPKNHPALADLVAAEDIMRDMYLDQFRLDLLGKEEAGDTRMKLALVGKGVKTGRPLHLNLNVNGVLEETINMGLRLQGF